MKIRWFISLPATAILSSLLSGCLASETPLITAANSDRPFPAHFLVSPDGTREKSARVDLADDNSYVVEISGDGNKARLYFKKISDNTYAVLKAAGEDYKDYQYGYAQISADGTSFLLQWPDCRAFDPADVEKMGVKIDRDPEGNPRSCDIPSVEVLVTMLTKYISDPKNADKAHEKDSMLSIIKE